MKGNGCITISQTNDNKLLARAVAPPGEAQEDGMIQTDISFGSKISINKERSYVNTYIYDCTTACRYPHCNPVNASSAEAPW